MRGRSPDVVVTSDASGSWGCGAFSDRQWLQLQWPSRWASYSIAPKELAPVILAAAVWGKQWAGKTVLFRCDNAAVVSCLRKGSAKDKQMLHLLRCLAFLAAQYDFTFTSSHVPGVCNQAADALSRNKTDVFLSLCPQVSREPTQLPQCLLELAILQTPDWTSQPWKLLFTAIIEQE